MVISYLVGIEHDSPIFISLFFFAMFLDVSECLRIQSYNKLG